MASPVVQPNLREMIHSRIGPIFDPAYLKLIPNEKIKEIQLIAVRAQLSTLKVEMESLGQVAQIIETTKVAR